MLFGSRVGLGKWQHGEAVNPRGVEDRRIYGHEFQIWQVGGVKGTQRPGSLFVSMQVFDQIHTVEERESLTLHLYENIQTAATI